MLKYDFTCLNLFVYFHLHMPRLEPITLVTFVNCDRAKSQVLVSVDLILVTQALVLETFSNHTYQAALHKQTIIDISSTLYSDHRLFWT